MSHSQFPDNVSVVPIKAFSDNYIWCIHNATSAYVVDPGDAQPVLSYCQDNQLTLSGVLITHHHPDHTGGIAALKREFPNMPVIGPTNDRIAGLTNQVKQGATLQLPTIDCMFSVIELPGHTLDHIAFYGHGSVFCGDTLFSAGCGRLFEGTPEQMHQSLQKLARLPKETSVYCTHEYTLANLAFARAVEPANQALIDYTKWAHAQRQNDLPTLPTNITTQKSINPFLRCDELSVINAVSVRTTENLEQQAIVFKALRQWKDEF